MKSNIHAIRQRKVELTAKNRALLDKAAEENRNLNETEGAQFEENVNALVKVEEHLIREEKQLESERSIGVIRDENEHAADRGHQPTNKNGQFASFGEQLMAIVKAGQSPNLTDPRLMAATAAGMSEAVPSDGGFLVQKDFASEVLMRTYATGQIVSRVRRIPIGANANGLKINAIDEDSRADGSRFGGVLAYWINEADAMTGSKPKFRRIELNLNKLIGLCYATDELLSDAAALEAIIMQTLPQELTFKVEDAIFSGTGVGQPLGLLNAGATLQIAKDAGDSTATVSANDVIAMWSRFWAPGLENSIASIQQTGLTPGAAGERSPGAAWFVDQSVLPKLFGMTIGSGTAVILLYHPPGYYGLPGPYGQMLGLPVIPVEHCSVLGTPGDIILADLSQYVAIDKGAPQAASSIHVKFLTDEMTFRFVYRVDGQPTWKKPLTPKNGGSTMAPFITLATRP